MEYFLIVVLCIAVVVLIARLAARGGQIDRLEESLASTERRLSRLEADVRRPAVPLPIAEAGPVQAGGPFYAAPQDVAIKVEIALPHSAYAVPAPSGNVMQPLLPMPPTPRETTPLVAAPEPQASPAPEPFVAARRVSIEERLGQNWLNKLGIVTLVIGIASFLGYKLQTLGPAGKSATGMALALALLGGGLLLERRAQYRVFARAAIGGGWALTFFVTFALYHVAAMQVLQSQAVDLMLMMLVASTMVAHSLRYKSQVVTSLAFLLAFVTVGISEVTLFSLVAGLVLACGLIFVAARERWFELALAGLVGVYLNHFLWLHHVLPDGGQAGHPFAEFLPSAALLLFYWLLFSLFYVLRLPETRRQEVVGSLTAVLNGAGLMSLLKYQSSHPEWAFWGLLVLGAAEMSLAFVARRRYRTGFVVLSSIASLLLLAAVPFRFSGSQWGGLWLLQAEMLFLVGVRLREVVFRRIGIVATLAASAVLVVSRVVPILVLRFGTGDATRHLPVTIMLASVALVLWFNAEFAARRWPSVVEREGDAVALAAGSYVAAGVAMLALWVLTPGDWTVVAWVLAGLAIFEFGCAARRDSLCWQGVALLAASFVRLFFVNLDAETSAHGVSARVLTIVPLIAAYLWVYARLSGRAATVLERRIAAAAAWAAAAAATALVYCEVRAEWVVMALALMALGLIAAAWLLRRTVFLEQSLVLVAAVAVRALSFNLWTDSTLAVMNVNSRVFTIGAACALLLLGLPFAFRVRALSAKTRQDGWRRYTVFRPEQPMFFVPLVLLTVLLAVQLRAGRITIAWSALGVMVFLFALTVKERSYRLAGLSLLLLGVAKILLIDVWQASPSERYLTLIVMGVALLLVSFLYSRYKETLLKFL